MSEFTCCKAPFVKFSIELSGDCWFCCSGSQKLYDSQPESFWVKFKKRFLTKNF